MVRRCHREGQALLCTWPPMTMSRRVESSHNCLPVVVIVTPTRAGMGQPSASPCVFITIHCCLLIKSQQDNSLSLVACMYPLQSQTASQPARDLAGALFSTHMCFPPHKMWHKLMILPNPERNKAHCLHFHDSQRTQAKPQSTAHCKSL